MGRGITIALLLSLALNVFAVGFLSGRVITSGPRAPEPAPIHHGADHPMGIMRHAKDLPPESRETFRKAIRADIPKLRAHQREMRKLQRAYYATLRAEEWDRAAVETAQNNLQEARDQGRALIDNAFLDALESLEPEKRILLLERAAADRGQRVERRRHMRQ